MTRNELITEMAKRSSLTKRDAEAALDAIMSITKHNLRKHGRLPLVGFGTFVTATRKARTGRNPQTGAPIQIKASKVVRFRPGKELKESI